MAILRPWQTGCANVELVAKSCIPALSGAAGFEHSSDARLTIIAGPAGLLGTQGPVGPVRS